MSKLLAYYLLLFAYFALVMNVIYFQMSLKIYFCGSIRAGRQDADLYARLIKLLQGYGTVLTEHVGSLKLEEEGRKKPVLRLRACLQRRHFFFCSVFFFIYIYFNSV